MNKFKFFLKRPKIVIVVGEGRKTAKEAISQVLERYFKIGKEILLYETDLKDAREFKFLVKKSRLPILVVTHSGEYHPEREFFAASLSQVSEAVKLARALPAHSYLILNFDDETVRDIRNRTGGHPLTFGLTFGFGARANIRATDVVLTQAPSFGTNFKINYEGNIVPVWLQNLFGKENVYAALAAVAVGEKLDLNLVEISEAFKAYQGLSGKMKLIEGVKKTWILDDSASASPLSMAEALEALKKIGTGGRKIAVLGDILGIGKYTIEAHEAIGERAYRAADLLFTCGSRAKFFAQGAKEKGMLEDKIFQFDEAKEAALQLQKEIKEGDLILVDGSKEIRMEEVIEEIKVAK